MRRVQTLVGEQVYEWLWSSAGQNEMIALAKLCSALFGTSGVVNGLACTQAAVPNFTVQVGAGEIYQMEPIEATTCGTLPANTAYSILKQGIQLGTYTTSNLTPPGSVGQSINYLIQAQYADQDLSLDPTTGNTPVVLQFYNSANPASPLNGPGGGGASSYTFRDGVIAFQVLQGLAATTGSQVTPTPTTGWIGLYVVTVAYGQSSITNSNISIYPNAPILPVGGLLEAVLTGKLQYADDTGAVNAYVVNRQIPALALSDGMQAVFSTPNANTSTTPTVNVDGLGAVVITQQGGAPVALGQIPANTPVGVIYNSTGPRYELQGLSVQTSKILPVGTPTVASSAMTVPLGAMTLDFRSPTQSNGGSTTIVIGAQSIIVPSGATLGSTNGVAATYALAYAYNGGTPVPMIGNMIGLNIDESTLVSPTTISASATAAGVWYSQAAVSPNSPFRIIGYLTATEATAGTWATAPSLTQGVGGLAGVAMGLLNTWQNMTGSRAAGTTYYNTGIKERGIQIKGMSSNGGIFPQLSITQGGVTQTVYGNIVQADGQVLLTASIPAGAAYSFNLPGGVFTLGQWLEKF